MCENYIYAGIAGMFAGAVLGIIAMANVAFNRTSDDEDDDYPLNVEDAIKENTEKNLRTDSTNGLFCGVIDYRKNGEQE